MSMMMYCFCVVSSQSFLQQLFPEIAVDEEVFSSWLDEFESQVQEKLEHMEKEVCMLVMQRRLDTVM